MTDRISALRAMAHPVRVRIVSLLTGTAMSAAEVARELDITHANASYHLRRLIEAGELVEAGEETIRGGVAKRYRYPHERGGQHQPQGRRATAEDRLVYFSALHREVEHRMESVAPRTRTFSFDLEGWVAPEVHAEAERLLEEASALLHDANRPPRTPGTVHVSVNATSFRMRQGR